jgi:type VI secretion system protein ImpM
MPGDTLIPLLPPIGFYGKVPARGDFVRRRLPEKFVQPWDAWVQSALTASREQLGKRWMDVYLSSPIWRFVLSPGNCGDGSWTGVIMPSVDKVGRCFPLTIAAPFSGVELPFLFFSGSDWFSRLELLALSTLNDGFDLEAFDHELRELDPPKSTHLEKRCEQCDCKNDNGRLIFHAGLNELKDIQHALFEFTSYLLSRLLAKYTLWKTNGSDLVEPSFIVYGGLPHSATDLMTGLWPRPPSKDSSTLLLGPLSPAFSEPAESSAFSEITAKERRLGWRSSARSTTGKVRKINEDAYLERSEVGLWAVADGMGGHSSGDVASKTVVEALADLSIVETLEDLIGATTERLQNVNADLLSMGERRGPGEIIGTTVVVLLAVDERCAVLWAGDSRLYQYRNGVLSQLTDDHSLKNEISRKGVSHEADGAVAVADNIVTRALGAEAALLVDTSLFEARAGDIYLLCSDGLVKEMNHQDIAAILSVGNCDESAQRLIDLALERGAMDNVTVVVVHAEEMDVMKSRSKS